MEYLTDWYAKTKEQHAGEERQFFAKTLFDLIAPFKKGYPLSPRKLGLDLMKAPFPVLKERHRRGMLYTITF